MARKRVPIKTADCPRCQTKRSVKVNDRGAWCGAFPCRWHVRWTSMRMALDVMRQAGVKDSDVG